MENFDVCQIQNFHHTYSIIPHCATNRLHFLNLDKYSYRRAAVIHTVLHVVSCCNIIIVSHNVNDDHVDHLS